ncbi:MAG: phage protein Gp27 family protein, partial [Sphingomicrobium sp.]
NIELMHSMILRLVTATNDDGDGQPVILDAEQTMFMARSLQALAGARKTNRDMILKERKAATEEAAKRSVDAAKSQGLSGDTVEFIRKAVLGSEG